MGEALTVMSAFAQLERDTIIERTGAGLEAARAQGRLGGGPPKVDAKMLARIRKLTASGEYSRAEIAGLMRISRATYRAIGSAD